MPCGLIVWKNQIQCDSLCFLYASGSTVISGGSHNSIKLNEVSLTLWWAELKCFDTGVILSIFLTETLYKCSYMRFQKGRLVSPMYFVPLFLGLSVLLFCLLGFGWSSIGCRTFKVSSDKIWPVGRPVSICSVSSAILMISWDTASRNTVPLWLSDMVLDPCRIYKRKWCHEPAVGQWSLVCNCLTKDMLLNIFWFRIHCYLWTLIRGCLSHEISSHKSVCIGPAVGPAGPVCHTSVHTWLVDGPLSYLVGSKLENLYLANVVNRWVYLVRGGQDLFR